MPERLAKPGRKHHPRPTPAPVQQPLPGDPDWIGGGNNATPGVWLTSANWNPAMVPGPLDIANFINSGTVVGIDMAGATNNGAANQAVGVITLTGNNNITIGNVSTTTAGTLTLNGATIGAVPNTILSNTATGKTLTLTNNVGAGNQVTTIALGNTANVINATAGNTISIADIISQLNPGSSIAFTGGGTLTLTKANTFSGGLQINSGTVTFNDKAALGTGTTTLGAAGGGNATLVTSAATANIANNIVVAAGSGGTLTLGSTSVAAASTSFNGTLTLNDGITLTGVNAAGFSVILNGVISGAGTITKIGAGAVTLAAANLFTGGVVINAGTVTAGTGTSLGPAANATLTFGAASTGKFQLNNSNTTVIDLNTNVTVGSPIVENGGANAKTLTVNTVNADTFAGVLQDGGSGSLAVNLSGTGSMTLSGTSTYTGGTTISNTGTLNINGSSALGAGALTVSASGATINNTSANSVTLSTNNAQAWNGDFVFTGSNNLNLGTGLVTLNGSRTVTANGSTLTIGGTVDIDSTNNNSRTLTIAGPGNVVFNGTIQNSFAGSTGSLSYSGGGTLSLNGPNTYTGTTTLSSGTVAIGNDSAFGTSSLAITGGSLTATGGPHSISNTTTLGLGGGTIAGTNDLSFTGSFTETGGDRTLTVTNSGTTTFGAVNLSNNNTGRTLTVAGTGNVFLNGVVANGGTSAGSLTFDPAYSGTTTINGANTYSGTTTLNGGSFILGNKSAFGTSGVAWAGVTTSANTDLSGINAIANSGTLKNINLFAGSNNMEFTGTLTNIDNSGTLRNTMSAGTLTLSGTLNLSNNTNSRTLTFNGTGNTTVSGVIQNGSTTAESITKNNGGTLQLTNVNTYTGTTTISGGVLDVNSNATTTGNLAGTTNVTVNAGGTLMFSNSGALSSIDRINDSAFLTMNGGTFKTGGLSEHGATNNTAGVGALTLQSSSILNLGNGTSVVAFANSNAQAWSGTLSIYNWTGSPSGGGTDQVYFGNDLTGLTAGQLADVMFYSDAGTTALGIAQMLANGEIVPTAVPEPGTWAIGALIGVGLVAHAKRRSRAS